MIKLPLPPASRGVSISPETPIRLSLLQALSLAAALLTLGGSIGALYPRLLALETTVERQGVLLARVADTVAKLDAKLEADGQARDR